MDNGDGSATLYFSPDGLTWSGTLALAPNPEIVQNPEVVHPDFQHEDHRGRILSYDDKSVPIRFVKTNISPSRKNVLRGIHVSDCYKLAYCPYGQIYVVVVDCREGETFGKWEAHIVWEKHPVQILVPPNFGLAHYVLSDWAVFEYRWSTPYDGKEQKTFAWNEPKFNIPWPLEHIVDAQTGESRIVEPILSDRDKNAPHL